MKKVIEHQDAQSERHLMDMAHNSTAEPDAWLKGVSATLTDYGPDGKKFSSSDELVAEIRARLRIGRRRKTQAHEAGWQWIYNPAHDVQAELRALRIVAPDLFNWVHESMKNMVWRAVEKAFPGSIGRRAFHSDSGRWHCEGSVCKYDAQGRKLAWSVNMPYDIASVTARYETRLLSGESLSLPTLRVNSRMAVKLRANIREYVRAAVKKLQERSLEDEFEATRKESLRIMIAQSIRREIALMLRLVARGEQKKRKAKSRIARWTAEYKEHFPAAKVPGYHDFSLLGLLTQVVDVSSLSAKEKEDLKKVAYGFFITYFRSGLAAMRSRFDKGSNEMDKEFVKFLFSGQKAFVEIRQLFRSQLIDAFHADRGGLFETQRLLPAVFKEGLSLSQAASASVVMTQKYDSRNLVQGRKRK